MRAAGAAIATWPLVWNAAILPHEYLSSLSAGELQLQLFGSLAQKTVKGVSAVCSSPAGASQRLSWSVSEAHIVLLGAGEGAGAAAPAPLAAAEALGLSPRF